MKHEISEGVIWNNFTTRVAIIETKLDRVEELNLCHMVALKGLKYEKKTLQGAGNIA